MLLGGNYLKAADLQGNEMIEFLNEGEWVINKKFTHPDGNPKSDLIFLVRIGSDEKDLRVNKTNQKNLTKAFGRETSKWVGRKARLTVENILVNGKKEKTIFLIPEVS